jgi:hypothetical protein
MESTRLPGRRMEVDSHQRLRIKHSGSGIRPPARAYTLSRGIVIRSSRLPGRRTEVDSHQRPMIKRSGYGIRPPARACPLWRAILVGSTRLRGRRMEVDSHQCPMIIQLRFGIRPPVSTCQLSIPAPLTSFNSIKLISIICTRKMVRLMWFQLILSHLCLMTPSHRPSNMDMA